MRRRLFNFASSLSLVLCVALMLAWARSRQYRDEYQFTRNGELFTVASEQGRIVIDNHPQIIDFRERQARQSAKFLGPREGGGYEVSTKNVGQLNAINAMRAPATLSHTLFIYWIGVLIAAVLPVIRLKRRFRRELRPTANTTPRPKAIAGTAATT